VAKQKKELNYDVSKLERECKPQPNPTVTRANYPPAHREVQEAAVTPVRPPPKGGVTVGSTQTSRRVDGDATTPN
jgi:hypothetical protein